MGAAVLFGMVGLVSAAGLVRATELAPPMLDISRQCDASSRHNVRAMSECVVAESEARAELLQNWSKISDGNAQKCIKAGRKAKRLPYSTMAKCLSVDASAPGGTAAGGNAPAAQVTR